MVAYKITLKCVPECLSPAFLKGVNQNYITHKFSQLYLQV